MFQSIQTQLRPSKYFSDPNTAQCQLRLLFSDQSSQHCFNRCTRVERGRFPMHVIPDSLQNDILLLTLKGVVHTHCTQAHYVFGFDLLHRLCVFDRLQQSVDGGIFHPFRFEELGRDVF